MSRIRLVALLVTAVCLSLSAGDAAIVPTEPLLVQQSGAKKKDKEKDKTIPSNCSPDRFPITVPDGRPAVPLSCCQDGNRTYHTNDGKTLAFRTFANPCTEADGVSTNCEGRGCFYGPCGAKIVRAVTAKKVNVFKPASEPEKCGWSVHNFIDCREGDCKDWPKRAKRSEPERFNNQEEYSGLTPGCPFTRCARGGKPLP
jgi:hypothetical protein